MEYRDLGKTGYRVSRLCMGTLTMGPLQLNLPIDKGADLIRQARDFGVNFFDTAHLYRTYSYIRKAISPGDQSVVIASRSYAYSASEMRCHLESALRATGRERIELFGLHEQESALTLRGHAEALEYLVRAQEAGKIGAVMVSSHHVELVRAVLDHPEIGVVHPMLNIAGVGIQGGTLEQMLAAIRDAHRAGKGIYSMKALAGGHLSQRAAEALTYVRGVDSVDSVALGIGSAEEIEFGAAVLSGGCPGEDTVQRLAGHTRTVQVEEWCTGCGRCARACPADAITVEAGRAVVDGGKCLLCGYCAGACEGFYIKMQRIGT